MTNGGGPSHGKQRTKKAAARTDKPKEPQGAGRRKRLLTEGVTKQKGDGVK